MEKYIGTYSNDPITDNYLFCKKRGYYTEYEIFIDEENGVYLIDIVKYIQFKEYKRTRIDKIFISQEHAESYAKLLIFKKRKSLENNS